MFSRIQNDVIFEAQKRFREYKMTSFLKQVSRYDLKQLKIENTKLSSHLLKTMLDRSRSWLLQTSGGNQRVGPLGEQSHYFGQQLGRAQGPHHEAVGRSLFTIAMPALALLLRALTSGPDLGA